MKKIIPVVAACILKRDPLRILLHLKNEPRNPELLGKWEFPGGMMDYGETPEQALKREIEEELGIKIQVKRLLYAQTNIYADQRHYLVLFYKCQPDSESTPDGCRWFNPVSLAKIDCLPGTSEVVRQLLKGAKRKKLTITQKVLLTLSRCKRGASERRLAGWRNKVSPNSICQALYLLKKSGLVSKLDRERFVITDTGIKKLEKDGLLKIDN